MSGGSSSDEIRTAGQAGVSVQEMWLKAAAWAVLLGGLGLAFRWLIDPWLGNRQPFTPAYGVIALAGWIATWRAGLLTAVICHLWGSYFFIAPRQSVSLTSADLTGGITFYLIAAVILYLGHRATTANAELGGVVAQLRESDRRRSEFIALLAHELRNPIAAIRSGIDLLATAKLDAPFNGTRTMMDRQVSHMSRLIQDLLDVARIDQGKIALQLSPVDFNAAVQQAVEAIRAITDARNQTVSVALPPQGLAVQADPERLQQILGNLLHNASKFSPPGSSIRVTASAESGAARLSVSDSGVGIPPAKLRQIFETFVQLKDTGGGQNPGQSLPASGDGLGLGLSLVRQLTQLHGGSVEALSPGLGQGAEFIVRLPLAPALAGLVSPAGPSAQRPMPAVDSARKPASALKILLVDDSADALDSLAQLLSLDGHRVLKAGDGASALTIAATEQPDVVLLDVGLPDISGHEVARRLRQQPGSCPLLVALTGWGSDDDKRRALEAGFDVHLAKPIRIDELERVLAELTRSTAGPGQTATA
ncbi:MAG: ATP-binding protein [Pseudomonadota bacterium]